MFGFGEKPSAPASPPAPSFSTEKEEEEKIKLALRILEISSCETQVSSLRSCAKQNNVHEGDEQRLRSVCASSVESLARCMRNVDHTVATRHLGAIAEQACSQQFSSFESCFDRHGEGALDACQREFTSTLACGAGHFLSTVERSQGTDSRL